MFRALISHPFWKYVGLLLIIGNERFWRLFKKEA